MTRDSGSYHESSSPGLTEPNAITVLRLPSILLLDSTFLDPVCKNYVFLDSARSKNLLYLGSFYSAALLTWALFATRGDFFSYRPRPPKLNEVSVKPRTSPTMSEENSRYLCILKVVLLSEITLTMDLSWAWYHAVIHAWSLPVVTDIGNFISSCRR